MDKKNEPATGHFRTKSPEAMMRGDTTKKPARGTKKAKPTSTEGGKPGEYRNELGDPGSEGY